MAKLKAAVRKRKSKRPGFLPDAKVKRGVVSEYDEQCAVVSHMYAYHPDVVFFSVPNEATRGALHYRAAGMLPGVCDLFIDKMVTAVLYHRNSGTLSPGNGQTGMRRRFVTVPRPLLN